MDERNSSGTPAGADSGGEFAEADRRDRLYNEQTRRVLERCLQVDSAAVDVGAHTGEVLRQMVHLAPRGRHFAFEPIPGLAAGLRARFPQVNVHQLALGRTTGVAEFQWVVDAPGYSGLRRRDYDHSDPKIECIEVETARLDEVLPSDLQVDLIKLDVEGGEHDVMVGGIETIRRSRPVIVFEAGRRSTSHYGVGPEDLWEVVTHGCGLRLSTMARWLAGSAGFERTEFFDHYNQSRDYYFFAGP